MQAPKSITSKQYPEFIRTNKVIQAFEKQEKVFHKIGLRNCSGVFTLGKYEEDAIDDYLDKLQQLLINEVAIQEDTSGIDGYGIPYFDCNGDNKRAFRNAASILTEAIEKDPASFVSKKRGKISLALPFEFKTTWQTYPKGHDLFKAIQSLISNSTVNTLDRMKSLFDEHNSFDHVLKKNGLRIVFSGNGGKGLWDLATMSMRGINSCQKWGNVHANALVGSLIDPYAGIIYVTDNKKLSHGINMIRRSVVRFVVHKTSRRPAVMIERVYPHDYDGGMGDPITYFAFGNFIERKTKGKFTIICGENRAEAQKYFIPLTEPVNKLIATSSERNILSDRELSYRDSKIQYNKSPKYQDVSKLFK